MSQHGMEVNEDGKRKNGTKEKWILKNKECKKEI